MGRAGCPHLKVAHMLHYCCARSQSHFLLHLQGSLLPRKLDPGYCGILGNAQCFAKEGACAVICVLMHSGGSSRRLSYHGIQLAVMLAQRTIIGPQSPVWAALLLQGWHGKRLSSVSHTGSCSCMPWLSFATRLFFPPSPLCCRMQK